MCSIGFDNQLIISLGGGKKMIIVDNIAEYETLSTIKNFCKNHDECKGCLYNFMCSFFNKDIVPENWEIKLELKKEESKKRQDIDITKQIQEKISDKLVDEKYDHMTSNEIAQSIMKNSLKKQ
jgi:hypothetical protein